ncbi:ankyrin [Penaeus vannamei]|uniref:Ankyrin n=1 Tax=Penaeus vannamei TaxID=6689 RepID=A0A3R7MQK4_PENVA|nr:ankyrin [Penaeus vannamei]
MASPRTQQKTLLDLARAGDAEALQAALASLAPRATKDFFAEKPLHVAAEEGHEEVAKTLILGGIDVNGKDEKGATPLHVAASKGHTSVVTALVTRGATVNGKTNRGSTPLHFAAQEGHEAAAEELIVKGADVNAKDKNGYTPLHLAAFNGHTAMVEMLIGKGAEPNAKGNGGSTPLHFAAQKGHEAAAEELIVKGADVNAKKVNEADGGYSRYEWRRQGLHTYIDLGRRCFGKTWYGIDDVMLARSYQGRDIRKKNCSIHTLLQVLPARPSLPPISSPTSLYLPLFPLPPSILLHLASHTPLFPPLSPYS